MEVKSYVMKIGRALKQLLCYQVFCKSGPFTVINYVPYIIKKAGRYLLGKNLTVSNRHAILIESDNVTFDLNGFTLDGSPSGANSKYNGVFSDGNHSNITIKNGTLSGFMCGVFINGVRDRLCEVANLSGSGHLVENLRCANNTRYGIRVIARGSVIRNNIITETTGCTLSENVYVFGIATTGPGFLVENNSVFQTLPPGTGEGVGISVNGHGTGTILKNNAVSNTSLPTTGRTFGIWVGGYLVDSEGVMLIDNNIAKMDVGVACSSPTSGVYKNNIVMDSTTPYLISSTRFLNIGNNYPIDKSVEENNLCSLGKEHSVCRVIYE